MKLHLILLLALSFLTSCAYHFGNPSQKLETGNLGIGEIQNKTPEASMTALLKNAVADQIAGEPGLRLAPSTSATAPQLYLTIQSLDNRSLARAKTRDREDVDHDEDAYQTVLYRISAKVAYEVRSAAEPGKVLCQGEITGQADLPKLPDREIALRTALRQLTLDLAKNLVIEITELR